MPSPFAVLAESPARRRARRVAKVRQIEQQLTSPEPDTEPNSPINSGRRPSLAWEPPAAAQAVGGAPSALSAEHGGGEPHKQREPLRSAGHAPVSGGLQTDLQDPAPMSREERRRSFRQSSRQHLRNGRTATASIGEPTRPDASPRGLTRLDGGDDGTPGALGMLSGMLSAYGSMQRAMGDVVGEALSETSHESTVALAMRTLPARSAFLVWRNAIAERRERARRFKLANAEGVHTHVLQWRLRPRWVSWVAYRSRSVLMHRSIGMMANSDLRGALQALKENAGEVTVMADRARSAFQFMLPGRRAMGKGLRKWVEYTAESLEFKAREQVCALACDPFCVRVPNLAFACAHSRVLAAVRHRAQRARETGTQRALHTRTWCKRTECGESRARCTVAPLCPF